MFESHGEAGGGHLPLHVADPAGAEVEDAGGEDGVGAAITDGVDHVGGAASAAAGDDGDADGVADRPEHGQVVAVLVAIGVHGGEQDLAGAAFDDFAGPGDGVDAGRAASAVRVDLVFGVGVGPVGVLAVGTGLGVDRDDDALAAEAAGALADKGGVGNGGGVNRDFVGARLQHQAHVGGGTDAATDGEGDEDCVRGAAHHAENGVALLVRGGDIEEDQLVDALAVVESSEFDGVAGVAQIDEGDALDDAAAVDVEAGDDALGQRHEGPPERAPGAIRAAASAADRVRRPS